MGETAPGDNLFQLATHALSLVIDRDAVAQEGQLPGGREPRHAAAYHSNLLARSLSSLRCRQESTLIAKVTNLDWLIDSAAGTAFHAGVGADRAADRTREGRVFEFQLESLIQLALTDEIVALLGRNARGAGEFAGSCKFRIVPGRNPQSVKTRGKGVVHLEVIMADIGEDAALHPVMQAEVLHGLLLLRPGGLFLKGQRTQLLPGAPVGKLCQEVLMLYPQQEVLHAMGQEINILLSQLRSHHILGQGRHRAADVDSTAHHAHAGALAQHGIKLLAVPAADHSLTAAHELKGEGAHILQHPKLRLLIDRVVLHQRTGTGTAPAADKDLAAGGAMACRITGIAPDGDDAAGVQPAHIGRSRLLHQDFRPRQSHGAHALTGVSHMEFQLLPLGMPEGAADIMLAGSLYLKISFPSPDRRLYLQQQVLGGHALMSLHCIYLKHFANLQIRRTALR